MATTKTVLITGAAGNLGGKLRRHLEAQGDYTLRLLDRDAQGDDAIQTADLSRYDEAWANLFKGVDAVVHLAADPSPRADWESVQRLNLDLMFNVFITAQRQGAQRVIFASSNWTMAGHRYRRIALTAETPPAPVNPYGASKLVGERLGRALSEQYGLSTICLRIGWCQHTVGNRPETTALKGRWGGERWLSDRDFCQGFERAILAEDVPFAVLNLVSDNAGARWDLETARRVTGYVPQDHYVPITTPWRRFTSALAWLRIIGLPWLAQRVARHEW